MTHPVSFPKVQIGGLVIDVLSRQQWAERMVAHCQAKKPPFMVFSVNGQVVATYARNNAYRQLIDQADALDADGQPLVIASRWLTKTPLPERVATTDFFHDAAALAEKTGIKFYFLASTQENLEIAVNKIRKQYPNLKIAGYRNGYFTAADEAKIVADIVAAGTDVLWVGLGVPRQEAFVLRHRQALQGVGWVKTCGGLFDYFTPQVKRAPQWMQKLGLEWLFRTWQEPRKYLVRYATTNGLAAWLLLTKTRSLD